MSAAQPETEIENALEVDKEAYNREDLLEYFATTYENPADCFDMTHAELIDWISTWANVNDALEEQERFQEMLEEIDEEYVNTWWTDEQNGEVMFYGAMKDPENEERYIIRDAEEDDPYTSTSSGYE